MSGDLKSNEPEYHEVDGVKFDPVLAKRYAKLLETPRESQRTEEVLEEIARILRERQTKLP